MHVLTRGFSPQFEGKGGRRTEDGPRSSPVVTSYPLAILTTDVVAGDASYVSSSSLLLSAVSHNASVWSRWYRMEWLTGARNCMRL